MGRGRPERDAGEGRGDRLRDLAHHAGPGDLVHAAVQHDHLAVEVVEGADTEVAVLEDLRQRDALAVDALHERVDRRALVDRRRPARQASGRRLVVLA